MTVQDITSELRERFDLAETGGVLVADVDRMSAAAQRGIVAGDIVLEVNRQPVGSVSEFRAALAKVEPGEWIVFLLSRKEQTLIVHLKKPQPSE
jgi:serine protease Do